MRLLPLNKTRLLLLLIDITITVASLSGLTEYCKDYSNVTNSSSCQVPINENLQILKFIKRPLIKAYSFYLAIIWRIKQKHHNIKPISQ